MLASVPTFTSSVSAVRQAVPPHASVSDGPPLLYGMFSTMVSMDVIFISLVYCVMAGKARRNDRRDSGGLPTADGGRRLGNKNGALPGAVRRSVCCGRLRNGRM